MNNAQLWALILGSVAPPFIAIIQQPAWPKPARSAVTVAVCLVLGLVTSYVNDEWAGRSVVSAILLTLVAAWSSYGRFWKPLGAARAIEEATSPADQPDPVIVGRQGLPEGLPDRGGSVDYPADGSGPHTGRQGPIQADGPASRDE